MLIPSLRMGMKIQVNVMNATAARTSTRTAVRRGLVPKMIRRVRDKSAVYAADQAWMAGEVDAERAACYRARYGVKRLGSPACGGM